jgi:NAD(P)-dependent dehydrogenase (short-subunit alcohol dehydrogenase family)
MKTVLITGASRGLGLEVARLMQGSEYRLVLTARDTKKFKRQEFNGAHFFELDVASQESRERLFEDLVKSNLMIDILINNAAVAFDGRPSLFDVDLIQMRATFETNVFGPFFLCQALFPYMMVQGYGRIVNVTSQQGSFDELRDQAPAYRVSKTALNAVTKVFADLAQRSGHDIVVNSVCPGWVRTDMGGASAPRSVRDGASDVVWAATQLSREINGKLLIDRKIAAF